MPKPNAFISACPSHAILTRLNYKWSMFILALLENGPVRFGDLKNKVEGISQKVLTQNLKCLERDGLIRRIEYDEKPLRVEYELTSLSKDLIPLILNIKKWTEENMHKIIEKNNEYDLVKHK